MPERIEELIKQDKGYFGSDAVPTVDAWDFYFREAEDDGKGWYRRVILDWGIGSDVSSYGTGKPASRNKVGEKTNFLYTSGKRKYANCLEEILHCQFGDCSAYAPFKYHSIRSLGWMLWGVCDLQNRLHCKFNEAVFEQLMWFFQTAGNQDMIRLKKANFEHMGIIPQGVRFLTPQERYAPNYNLIQMAFARNRQLMADSSTTYTQDYEKTTGQNTARTATETMAIVNSAQSLAGGIVELAYGYETFKYREMGRRLCLKNNTDPLAREFRLCCLKDGIPENMLDIEKWTLEPERVVGGGNKTIQMATVGFLNQIRRNLPPNGQRLVDHMSVEAATDQPELAEEIAPLGGSQPISHSMTVAQNATERLLGGLPFQMPDDAVYEDYVTVWLHDLGFTIQKIMQQGGMATPDQLNGLLNLGTKIGELLKVMGQNPEEKEKIRQYEDAYAQLMNHVKGLAQRLQQQMDKQQPQQGGDNGEAAKEQAKVQAMLIQAQTKAKIAENSAAARTQQKEVQFQNAERRKDEELEANLQRDGAVTRHDMMAERLKALAETEK
jgi:hypothetical protein